MFDGMNIDIKSMADAKIAVDFVEDGSTFAENSLIKANAIRKHTKDPILTDDSGLVIPWLNCEPGLHSARYAGPDADDEDNRIKLMKKMKQRGIKFTDAYFICVMSLLIGDDLHQFTGTCYGYVKDQTRGSKGFGYDPMFYMPGSTLSLAELEPEEKNRISNRFLALEQVKNKLKNPLEFRLTRIVDRNIFTASLSTIFSERSAVW